MSETKQVPTSSWVSMVAGPLNVNLQNQSPRHVLQYTTASATPSNTTVVGVRLYMQSTHPVNIATGDNLYIKCSDADSGDLAVAISVP